MDAAGAVLHETYPSPGARDRAWELASGTKSFCGIAAAAAVKDGLLRLDGPCADVLPEWRGDARATITLRQVLTLTSGLSGGRRGRPPDYADAIAVEPGTAPGARFQYSPAPFQIFGEMLRRTTGADPLTYLQARLFDPIGIRPQRWRRGLDGFIHLPSGAAFTARDWATFGAMTVRGWRVNGQALLDDAALAANFTPSAANPGYGLTWWLLRPGLVAPSPRSGLNAETIGAQVIAEDVVMAAGAGHQRLYLLRKRGLVVVRQASGVLDALAGRGVEWSDTEFLRRLLTPV
jgi:CubicO group peptidase (beta-lactamase class C family)